MNQFYSRAEKRPTNFALARALMKENSLRLILDEATVGRVDDKNGEEPEKEALGTIYQVKWLILNSCTSL